MKFKKCLALFLVISIISCISSVSASAKTVSAPPILTYTQISDVANELTVSERTLSVYAASLGYFNATRCGVTATLQKLSGSTWVRYRVWDATSTSSNPDYAVVDTSITVSPGQYRLVSSHSVTVGAKTEYEGMMSPVKTVY